MEQIKLIIPGDFRSEINETDFMILNEKENKMTDSNYQMNMAELVAEPSVQLFLASISILAIPSSLEGIFNLIGRVKKYLSSSDHTKTFIIQIKGQRYIIDDSTSDESYQEILDLFEKLSNEGRLVRKL